MREIEYKKEVEEFRDIPNYKGLYMVSDLGNIKSLRRTIKHYRGGDMIIKEKILKPREDKDGYLMVNLCKNSIRETIKIHQLVAMAFKNHKRCGLTKIVDHKNNIKTDNRATNLKITTVRINTSKDRKGYTSNYIGVSWNKKSKKWVSMIWIKGKLKYLGSFNNEIHASIVYNSALRIYNKKTKH